MQRARLQHADLGHANLSHTNLSHAILQCADLYEAMERKYKRPFHTVTLAIPYRRPHLSLTAMAMVLASCVHHIGAMIA